MIMSIFSGIITDSSQGLSSLLRVLVIYLFCTVPLKRFKNLGHES